MADSKDNLLEQAVTSYVTQLGEENVISNDAMKGDVQKKLKQMIIEEIENQIRLKYKSELLLEADQKAKENAKLYKINEFKAIMISGIIIAFLMGLGVNQLTDFITYLKTDTLSSSPAITTLIIAGVCISICVLLFIYNFIIEALKIIKKEGKGDPK